MESYVQIRSARVYLRLLPGLRRVLSSVTHLEIGIPVDVGSPSLSFKDVCEILRPHSSTLTLLNNVNARDLFWNHWHLIGSDGSTPFPPVGCRVSFPFLQRLKLVEFTDYIVLNILSTFDCPSLLNLSISIRKFKIPDDERLNYNITATLLHRMHPLLECISVDLHAFEVCFNN